MASLENRQYFPAFSELPESGELDYSFYQETQQGGLVPARSWCFAGEIVDDSLSQIPVLGHRVEVKDVLGEVRSILFYPDAGTLDFAALRRGHSLFIRYAHRCYFSDLSTEAIKVEDLDYCKVIRCNMDSLLALNQHYFSHRGQCLNCGAIAGQQPGSSTALCPECGTATYCTPSCLDAHHSAHSSHCYLCSELKEVVDLDWDRFFNFVPFPR